MFDKRFMASSRCDHTGNRNPLKIDLKIYDNLPLLWNQPISSLKIICQITEMAFSKHAFTFAEIRYRPLRPHRPVNRAEQHYNFLVVHLQN